MNGRWPANVILSPDMAEALDEQSGNRRGAVGVTQQASTRGLYEGGKSSGHTSGNYGTLDSGGASRFFLQAGYEPWEYDWIIANGLTPCGQ